MIRKTAVLALAVASLTAACAQEGPKPFRTRELTSRPIGQQAGDTIEVIPGAVDGRPTTVISIVRTFDLRGYVAACGALVLAAPKTELADLAAFATDRHSALVVGPESAVPQRLPPGFMHRYLREVADGSLEVKDVDLGSVTGDCIVTDIPWLPDYESANKLELKRLVLGGKSEPPAVYMPPTKPQ